MTTTSNDNNSGDQDDIMRGEDSPPHLSHPGTENPENPTEFHKKSTKCSPNPSLVNEFSATPRGQLNWTGPIANSSETICFPNNGFRKTRGTGEFLIRTRPIFPEFLGDSPDWSLLWLFLFLSSLAALSFLCLLFWGFPCLIFGKEKFP